MTTLHLRRAGTAVALMALAAAAVPAAAAPPVPERVPGIRAVVDAPLTDLQTDRRGPFDGASATVVMTEPVHGHTGFALVVRGVDAAAQGTSYGAHLHVGPCVAGDGAAAGPHYNSSTTDPPEVSPRTEVWLDLTPDGRGAGMSTTAVPFVPTGGQRSVVIHEKPTAPDGTAGARLACVPLTYR